MQKYSRLINPPMIFSTEPNQIQHSKDKSANNNQVKKKLPLEFYFPRNFYSNLKLKLFSERSEISFASASRFWPNKYQNKSPVSINSSFVEFRAERVSPRALIGSSLLLSQQSSRARFKPRLATSSIFRCRKFIPFFFQRRFLLKTEDFFF